MTVKNFVLVRSAAGRLTSLSSTARRYAGVVEPWSLRANKRLSIISLCSHNRTAGSGILTLPLN